MPLTPSTTFPNGYTAADYGYLAMNFDPAVCANTSTPVTGGTLYVMRLALRRRMLVTNIVMQVFTAGATLTSGQNFAGLYSASGTQLGATATQHTAWQTGGTKVMALTSAQDCLPGFYDIAFYSVGTTKPAFMRVGGDGNVNLGLTTADLRVATSNTGLTTALPSPSLATKVTTNAFPIWVAVS